MTGQLFLPSHGAKAVRGGRYGEETIEGGFRAYGVKIVRDDHIYHGDHGALWARCDKILIKQFEIQVVDVPAKIDFVYRDFQRGIILPIESKSQKRRGTTDEKLSHTVDRLASLGFPAFWLVLNGGGFKPVITKLIYNKIRSMTHIAGRLVFNDGPFLQRAIENLVDKGEC